MKDQLICLDFGLKSIGVATGQTDMGIATPLREVRARDGIPIWDELDLHIREWQPTALIVGLPLNMDGSESPLCQRARKFAARLNGRYHLPLTLVDERLTSRSAKNEMQELGHRGNYRQAPVDSVAACLILEQYFAGVDGGTD